MDSLNRMALELVDEALDFATELDIGVTELESEATVLDFGVDVDGGIEAGLLLTEIQTAGLATVQTGMGDVGDTPLTHVELATDQPDLALLCAQKAGWELSVDDFEGLGSGPARALVAAEDVFGRVGYADSFDFGILAVESEQLPDEDVAAHVAERADLTPGEVFLVAFPSASIVGSVSMAARAGELAAYRLCELGYDPMDILSVSASAPVAPVAGDERTAMARGTDAVAYGGEVHLHLREDFDRFDELPSTAATEYGRPTVEVFDDADWDMTEIDQGVFAPAAVTVDVVGGPTESLGGRDEDLLLESFGL